MLLLLVELVELVEFAQEPACVAGMIKKVFMRAKVTVRVKWTRVNSVFLVQLRKKVARDFADQRG